jgi:hypothetical protein
MLFECKSTEYIYNSLANRVPGVAKLNQATKLPKYDEMESLQAELKSCSFGVNTLLDVVREAVRKCSIDNYAEPSPGQVMNAISDVVGSPELGGCVYLVYFGLIISTDGGVAVRIPCGRSQSVSSAWPIAVDTSLGCLRLKDRTPDPTNLRRSAIREHKAWRLAGPPVALVARLG